MRALMIAMLLPVLACKEPGKAYPLDALCFAKADTRRTVRDDEALLCAVDPGVRVRFHCGEDSADLLLCYECGMLALVPAGADCCSRPWFDFGYERPDLVGWARTVFPDEPAFFAPIERL